MYQSRARVPVTPRARVAAFLGILAVALSVGLTAGQWAGPVESPAYGTSADPHAGH